MSLRGKVPWGKRISFELVLDVIQTDVHPISLIKFWADHVIQIGNFIILSHEGCYHSSSVRKAKNTGGLDHLPVSPNFEWALIVVTTLLNIAAGTTWTSSRRIKPHSREVRNSIIFLDSCDLLCVFATMEYVDTTIPLSPANYMSMRTENMPDRKYTPSLSGPLWTRLSDGQWHLTTAWIAASTALQTPWQK